MYIYIERDILIICICDVTSNSLTESAGLGRAEDDVTRGRPADPNHNIYIYIYTYIYMSGEIPHKTNLPRTCCCCMFVVPCPNPLVYDIKSDLSCRVSAQPCCATWRDKGPGKGPGKGSRKGHENLHEVAHEVAHKQL